MGYFSTTPLRVATPLLVTRRLIEMPVRGRESVETVVRSLAD